MKITKSWRSHNKNVDRWEFKIRFGAVTIIEVVADLSDKRWRIGLLNTFISN